MLSTIWILLRSVNTRILPALGNVTVLAAAVTSFVLGGTAAIVEGLGRGFGVTTAVLGVGVGLTLGVSDCWYTTIPSPIDYHTTKTTHNNFDFLGGLITTSAEADIIWFISCAS